MHLQFYIFSLVLLLSNVPLTASATTSSDFPHSGIAMLWVKNSLPVDIFAEANGTSKIIPPDETTVLGALCSISSEEPSEFQVKYTIISTGDDPLIWTLNLSSDKPKALIMLVASLGAEADPIEHYYFLIFHYASSGAGYGQLAESEQFNVGSHLFSVFQHLIEDGIIKPHTSEKSVYQRIKQRLEMVWQNVSSIVEDSDGETEEQEIAIIKEELEKAIGLCTSQLDAIESAG